MLQRLHCLIIGCIMHWWTDHPSISLRNLLEKARQASRLEQDWNFSVLALLLRSVSHGCAAAMAPPQAKVPASPRLLLLIISTVQIGTLKSRRRLRHRIITVLCYTGGHCLHIVKHFLYSKLSAVVQRIWISLHTTSPHCNYYKITLPSHCTIQQKCTM